MLYVLGSHEQIHDNIKGGNSYDNTFVSNGEAFVLEGLGTMFLVLTVLSTIHEKRGHAPSYLQPLAIGVAILVIHIWLVRRIIFLNFSWYIIFFDPNSADAVLPYSGRGEI